MSKPDLITLTVIPSDCRYRIKLVVQNAVAKTLKQVLDTLDYITGELTALMAVGKTETGKIYKDIGNVSLAKGKVNIKEQRQYMELIAK